MRPDSPLRGTDGPPEVRAWAPSDVPLWAKSLFEKGAVAVYTRVDTPAILAFTETFPYSDEERERAGRYRMERNRAEFLVARGIVRTLLGHVLGSPPEALVFDAPPFEKPRLIPACEPPIDVSISHSGSWVACGFAIGRGIGVDIEVDEGGPSPDIAQLAPQVFTPGERDLFDSLPEDIQRDAFFDAWRRKEATLKAIGLGLTGDPTALEVLLACENGRVSGKEVVSFNGRHWRIAVVTPGDGPAMAIALETPSAT